jgi:hypothetical protein
MPAIGQKLACAQGESTREELSRRSNDDATEATDACARERGAAGTSLLPWLDVEDPARPGTAIWIVALAVTICIGLTYAYFSRVTG